ncbi:MAG: NADPH-dependent F420 reductase [Anaerolinea sp.]|nr:NADPH-dependent F420 reductase [Anaerolinea sp.]
MTEETTTTIKTIAIAGGTGKEGKGLAYRWAKAGYQLIIGSRQLEKAQAAADALNQLLKGSSIVTGMLNSEAAQAADLVVLTVPFSAHIPTLEGLKEELKGKILVDVSVPLVPPKVSKVQMPPSGSAALEAKQVLGEESRIVSAFQNISYEHLLNDEEIICDVLVTGTDKEARSIVLKLVKDAGMVGWDAGPIENSVVAEGMTSILIGLNKQYGVQSAGIKITGVSRE